MAKKKAAKGGRVNIPTPEEREKAAAERREFLTKIAREKAKRFGVVPIETEDTITIDTGIYPERWDLANRPMRVEMNTLDYDLDKVEAEVTAHFNSENDFLRSDAQRCAGYIHSLRKRIAEGNLEAAVRCAIIVGEWQHRVWVRHNHEPHARKGKRFKPKEATNTERDDEIERLRTIEKKSTGFIAKELSMTKGAVEAVLNRRGIRVKK